MNAIVDPTIVWLGFRQLFVRRRLAVAIAFALVPLAIALVYRATHASPDPERAAFAVTLYRDIVMNVLVPLVAVVLGTSVFGAEIDDGTIVYLLVKPLARWRLVTSRYVVAVCASALVAAPMIALPWLVFAGAVAPSVPLAFAAGAGVAVVLYCALFVTLGFITKRALIIGLLYVVIIELVISPQVAGVKSLSVREFATTIIGKLASGQPGIVSGTVALSTVATTGVLMLVITLGYAMWRLRRYELAERL